MHEIGDEERFWVNHYEWLKTSGYELRSRWAPGWTASWLADPKKDLMLCDDFLSMPRARLMDATRICDQTRVLLKLLRPSYSRYEQKVQAFFSQEPQASDPRNHCVPLLETLEVPDEDRAQILVMPILRKYDSPAFDTIGEALGCIQQIFEGLQFMHHNNVAHRDISTFNLMMDGSMFTEEFHPAQVEYTRDLTRKARYISRTWKSPKYYLIDFGLSRRFEEGEPHIDIRILGGVKTVPEARSKEPYDPFLADIYCLGHWVDKEFVKGRNGFDFLRNLSKDMMQEDASKRPTIDEAVRRLQDLIQGLSAWKVRSRASKRHGNLFIGLGRVVKHWPDRIVYIYSHKPAVPVLQ
ncbi:hypothetical protein CONPUDRAFT_53400 [Coniophora puteana RWD-64-598 SS2]|uniref:Protein kinase domain-containing protein n=1 Tax=Coniophora puteana (strain RWD-64-598) TaxID=741705 RepID=A0A5M3MWT8_CONPW|nr:uncharacterized protein CONPUDRAFT_53400 [Coniophora puteana RWD-64-598 SS2]EIW83457.1 hypothetical protein CONPUDRAFT_53400 [Coniophora puteana RWD-64-598 SS2]